MESLVQDLSYAVRQLRRSPALAFAAVFTLALGLGATTAVMSVVYTVVLAPPPYADPGTLVQIARVDDGRRILMLPAATVQTLQESSGTFSAIGIARFQDISLGTGESPERVRGVVVSGRTLQMLGVAPALGRLPGEAEDTPGGPCVVVLSHRIWAENFGADPDITGNDARLDGAPCTIAGVMPSGFAFPAPYFAPGDLWLLAGPAGVDWSARAEAGFLTFGRLAPGSGLGTARAELDVIGTGMSAEGAEPPTRFTAMPWAAPIRDENRQRLLLLLAAGALVLLIASVNIVNLQLARGVDRRGEIATRMALGASHVRLVRHVMAETLMLFLLGAAGGLLFAGWGLKLIVGLRSFYIPRMEEAEIDAIAVAVCFGTALVIGLVTTLITALRLSDGKAASTLRLASTGVTAGPRGRRFGRVVVSVETAMAIVLMSGAALLFESYRQSSGIDPGFRTADILHGRVTPPPTRYPDEETLVAFYRELQQRAAALPGVLDVTLTNVPPGVGSGANQPFAIDGMEATPAAWSQTVWRSVSDTYFQVLDIPLLRGAGFEEAGAQARVAIVNERFAAQFLPDRDPVGERLKRVPSQGADAPEAEAWTIIGVVADAREAYAYESAPPVVYVRFGDQSPRSMAILARTVGEPLALAGGLRGAVAEVDPDLPVFGLRDLEFIMASELDLNRLSLVLLALFAGIALALAIAGIYGVVAHITGQRGREMGIRLALGAHPSDVLRLVVGDYFRYAVLGTAAGLVLIVTVSERLATLTLSWAGTDVRMLAAAAVVVMAVAALAAYLPARRAALVDPVQALRGE